METGLRVFELALEAERALGSRGPGRNAKGGQAEVLALLAFGVDDGERLARRPIDEEPPVARRDVVGRVALARLRRRVPLRTVVSWRPDTESKENLDRGDGLPRSANGSHGPHADAVE
jgi:hypothetical protein